MEFFTIIQDSPIVIKWNFGKIEAVSNFELKRLLATFPPLEDIQNKVYSFLSLADKIDIIELYHSGNHGIRSIAKMYEVHPATITRIIDLKERYVL